MILHIHTVTDTDLLNQIQQVRVPPSPSVVDSYLFKTKCLEALRWAGEVAVFMNLLKGYSGVILIHGQTHCGTVLDSLSRDSLQTAS